MESGCSLVSCSEGGYRCLPGVFQYSGGVAAETGFEIERACFLRMRPLAEGFAAIRAHLTAIGRPLAALCACELRSPAPFTEEGFRAFNGAYVGTLAEWGIYREGRNPVARSNVCPEAGPPTSPSVYAFSYTVRSEAPWRPSFVIAGSGEVPEGRSNYRDHIVARGDVSPAGLVAKARWVLGEMERRMGALGMAWADATATQLYTVHNIYPLLGGELARRGAMPRGLTWHYCRPPVVELEFEMDVRGLRRELAL